MNALEVIIPISAACLGYLFRKNKTEKENLYKKRLENYDHFSYCASDFLKQTPDSLTTSYLQQLYERLTNLESRFGLLLSGHSLYECKSFYKLLRKFIEQQEQGIDSTALRDELFERANALLTSMRADLRVGGTLLRCRRFIGTIRVHCLTAANYFKPSL